MISLLKHKTIYMNTNKFTIKDFKKLYPNNDACLEAIFVEGFGHNIKCPQCKNKSYFYRVKNRKCYSCNHCGYQIHPLADTIFHKSSTSLWNWFFAMFLFSASKNGVSAKELERQLGVTYKTAWRMAKQIRLLFDQSKKPLSNTVEIDETYIGGKFRGKRGRGSENKTSIIGLAERKGEIRAKVTINVKSSTVHGVLRENVIMGINIISDEFKSYSNLTKLGFKHYVISHGQKEWAKDDIHTNTLEGFWSQFKRSVNGTYHSVSPKYLQNYLNEFVFRYNLREYPNPLFGKFLGLAVRQF